MINTIETNEENFIKEVSELRTINDKRLGCVLAKNLLRVFMSENQNEFFKTKFTKGKFKSKRKNISVKNE